MTIDVGNLSIQAEREDLLDLFSQYAEGRQCCFPLDRDTGRNRGFAFVDLDSDASDQKAMDDLQYGEWMTSRTGNEWARMIRIDRATPRAAGGGGCCGYGNRGGGRSEADGNRW